MRLPTLLSLLGAIAPASACTNILIDGAASATGDSMIGYNADSGGLYGGLSHWAWAEHAAGSKRQIYSWDLGIHLGEIDEPKSTYNVMGNANCQGLVIGETTLGGLSELSNVGKDWRNGTILDYGSLIWVTLSRAATAREAISVMSELTTQYGYASDMEGFSISDSTTGEVWYMEFIGKGSFEKGAVWVALRVPDGHFMAHANQARIRHFLPCDDANTCRMAADVVTFAIERGYWRGKADDPAFSFSDTYDPLTVFGARFCEARVWYLFSQLADPADFDPEQYLDYAQARETHARGRGERGPRGPRPWPHASDPPPPRRSRAGPQPDQPHAAVGAAQGQAQPLRRARHARLSLQAILNPTTTTSTN